MLSFTEGFPPALEPPVHRRIAEPLFPPMLRLASLMILHALFHELDSIIFRIFSKCGVDPVTHLTTRNVHGNRRNSNNVEMKILDITNFFFVNLVLIGIHEVGSMLCASCAALRPAGVSGVFDSQARQERKPIESKRKNRTVL